MYDIYRLAIDGTGGGESGTVTGITYSYESDHSAVSNVDAIGNVKTALDYIIDTILNDVDISDYFDTHGGREQLAYDKMPGITLLNVEPISEYTGNTDGIWFKNDGNLYYHYNATDLSLGAPVDMLYYYSGNVYKYDSSTHSFIKTGDVKLLEGTNMLLPAQWPQVVIRNISDTVLDDLAVGDIYYDQRHLYLHESENNDVDLGEPKRGTIYCLKSTEGSDSLYRWTGSVVYSPWKLISSGGTSGPVDISGKADLETGMNMLEVQQWPKVIITSVEPVTPQHALANLEAGDLFVMTDPHDDSHKLYIINSNSTVSQVEVSKTVLYYAVDSRKFYTYSGTIFEQAVGDSIQLNIFDKIPAEYGHIIPVASMGYGFDNVSITNSENIWGYEPHDGDYYVDPDTKVVYLYNNEVSTPVGYVWDFDVIFNTHTGRYYYFGDNHQITEYPVGGIQLDSAGLIPYPVMPKNVLDGM